MTAIARRFSPLGAMLVQFFGFGIAAGLWSGSVPAVARAAAMDTAGLGLSFTGFMAAYIGGMTLAGRALSHGSTRQLLLFGLPANALAIAMFLSAGSPLQLTLGLLLIGLVMGFIDLVMNHEGTLVEADRGRTVLSRLHGFASIGTAVGAISGSVFALTWGTWVSVGLGVVMLGLAMLVISAATPERAPVRARSDVPVVPVWSASLLIIGIIFGIGMAGESAAGMWSARLLEEQAPRLAVISGIGLAFFAGCQAMMRLAGDGLRRTFGDRRLVAASLLVGASGFFVIGQSTGFAASVAGFALVGVGTAMMAPCIFALAAAARPGNGGGAMAFIALVAGAPRLVSPWAFGAIASTTSTGVAFGLIAVTFIAALALAVVSFSRRPALAG